MSLYSSTPVSCVGVIIFISCVLHCNGTFDIVISIKVMDLYVLYMCM